MKWFKYLRDIIIYCEILQHPLRYATSHVVARSKIERCKDRSVFIILLLERTLEPLVDLSSINPFPVVHFHLDS